MPRSRPRMCAPASPMRAASRSPARPSSRAPTSTRRKQNGARWCVSSGSSRSDIAMTQLILTGDINLMKVTDGAVPFARVGDELRKADLVFGNLECCLYASPNHSLSNEGFIADPVVGGEALKNAGIQAVGIANNVHYGDPSLPASTTPLPYPPPLH